MKEKYGFVYLWRDRGKNRWYLGSRWGREDDGYICSSNWMRMSHKRRPQDFKRRILFRCNTKEELWDKEFEWLSLINQEELGKKYYNLKVFHYNMNQGVRKLSEKTRKRLSEVNRGKNNPNYGKKASEETKRKMSENHKCKNKGFVHPRPNKGKKISEETRQRMSEAAKQRTQPMPSHTQRHTEEAKKRMSEAHKGLIPWHKGKVGVYSEETRRKMSEAAKKRWSKIIT